MVFTLDSKLSQAQSLAVAATGNAFIDAGPGTGKTHVIVARVAHLIAGGVDPRRILVLTFSRRAAAELRERLARDPGAACEVRTFHGFASRLLEADGPRFKSRRLLDAFSQSLLLDAALARSPLPTLSAIARKSKRFRADLQGFAADAGRAEATAVAQMRVAASPRLRDLLATFDELARLRELLRASDLQDLIARAVAALADEQSTASLWLAGRYTHVLVDEFQDVDATQLALLGRLQATIFAVGDAAQAIYAFRGALRGVIDDAVARFTMERFALAESRRCPQAICDLAASTPLLGAKRLTSLRDASGSIEVRAARTTLDEAALIGDRVEDAIAAGRAPERIAVLLRGMRPLGAAVEAELSGRNIAVAGGGRDAFLADPQVEAVRLGLRLLAMPGEIERWVAFFGIPALGFDRLRVRTALRAGAIGSIAEGCLVIAAEQPALASSCPIADVATTLQRAEEAFAADEIGRAARRLLNGLGLAARVVRSDAGLSNVRASVGRLGRLVDTLGTAQRHLKALGRTSRSTAVLEAFEERIEELAAEETPATNVPGVRLLSIHGAKGLEFEVVIIGNAVEGAFPSSFRPSTLLDDADLAIARASGVDLVGARDDSTLIEEAALWYVAVTRTRDTLLVTYASHGADGAPQRPSRFLPAKYHPAPGLEPFERRLERLEGAVRLAGDAAVLEKLFADLAGSPTLRAMLAEGEHAFSALPLRPVVYARDPSVSAAGDWFQCPRRFYYKHVINLGNSGGESAEIGTALHAILAKFHEEFNDFTDVRDGDVSRWIERLSGLRRARWDAEPFEPVAKDRAIAFFADRVLGDYAMSLEADAGKRKFKVVAREHSIISRYGSRGLRGKLDRVDRTSDGELILRDYKSGRKHASFAKLLAKAVENETGVPVAGSVDEYFAPQLALYRRGAEVEFGARVASLEYVYLKGNKDDEASPIAYDALLVDAATKPHLEKLDTAVERGFLIPIAAGIEGSVVTTSDDQVCKFCDFKTICPGVKT